MPDQPENTETAGKTTVEVFIAMNEDGDAEIGLTEEEATDRFNDNVGGHVRRMVKRTFRMTPPQIVDTGIEDVPDDAGETVAVETEAA